MSIQAGGTLFGSGCGCPCQLPAHGSTPHRAPDGSSWRTRGGTGGTGVRWAPGRWPAAADERAAFGWDGSRPCATAPAKSGARAAGSGLTPFRSRLRRGRPSPPGRRGRWGRWGRHDHIVCDERSWAGARQACLAVGRRRSSIVDRRSSYRGGPVLACSRDVPTASRVRPGGRSCSHCGQTRRLRHGHRRCHGLRVDHPVFPRCAIGRRPTVTFPTPSALAPSPAVPVPGIGPRRDVIATPGRSAHRQAGG